MGDMAMSNEILSPGRNCWTSQTEVTASGLVIDGRDYFQAFYRAASAARSYIAIAGWKFSSDVRLLRGRDAEEAGDEEELLPFLKRLCESKPDLQVYILAWDFSVIYMLEWESDIEEKFNQAHERIQFRFDSQHVFGGSHHQKFIIIDGHTAFLGGLDFNGDTWDERTHPPTSPHRAGCDGQPRGPYHDVQAYLVGPAAQELACYFANRWDKAGHGQLRVPAPLPSPCPAVQVPLLPIAGNMVAFSENQPNVASEQTPALQIRELYRDAIAAAEELIYIENQYFSAEVIEQALSERMRAAGRPRLDIVVMLPKHLHGWVESTALEPPRLEMLESLSATAQATGHRLGFYYSATQTADETELQTLIHSKLLIVDDRFLTVGSANIANRSMGLDSELNVSWEARGKEDRPLADSIRRARADLLAEHCGALHDEQVIADLLRGRGLVERLNRRAMSGQGRLRNLTREKIIEDRAYISYLAAWGFSLDPKTA